MTRNFTHRKATRGKIPLLVSLVGPSSCGKTLSALRLTRGFQRVKPGKTFVIDTEGGRSLQYAEQFDFEYVPFGAPFGPLDYLDVIKYCVDKGATDIVIDSMSHEHEGPGGLLEIQAVELARLGPKLQGLSWNKPKSEHRRLINTILGFNCNFIFCFRAREKLDWDVKPPKALGIMAIGDPGWKFEMTLQCLLMPGCKGVPTWKSDMLGEIDTMKLPGFFEPIFANGPQLTEDVGEQLARWAAGTTAPQVMSAADLLAEYAACSEPSELRRLEEVHKTSWSAIGKEDRPKIKEARELCVKRIEEAAKAAPIVPADDSDDDDEQPFDDAKAAS